MVKENQRSTVVTLTLKIFEVSDSRVNLGRSGADYSTPHVRWCEAGGEYANQ